MSSELPVQALKLFKQLVLQSGSQARFKHWLNEGMSATCRESNHVPNNLMAANLVNCQGALMAAPLNCCISEVRGRCLVSLCEMPRRSSPSLTTAALVEVQVLALGANCRCFAWDHLHYLQCWRSLLLLTSQAIGQKAAWKSSNPGPFSLNRS